MTRWTIIRGERTIVVRCEVSQERDTLELTNNNKR